MEATRNGGAVVLLFGVLLVVTGIAKKGLRIDIHSVRICVEELTPKNRQFALVLGIVLAISGAGMLAWPLFDHGGEPRTTVVVPGGQGSTSAYRGPSTDGYPAAKTLLAGTPVVVVCTVYGEPSKFPSAIWDYTDKGWLNDHFVGTGGRNPSANGCIGNVAKPTAGKTSPSLQSGPYAVIADEGLDVPVHAGPGDSAIVGNLRGGDLVRVQCATSQGSVVPAPRALGNSRSNNVWDRIVAPPGWLPDSYVATYSVEPIAPRC